MHSTSRIKKRRREAGEDFSEEATLKLETRMLRRSWLCEDVEEGVGGSRVEGRESKTPGWGEDLGCSRT